MKTPGRQTLIACGVTLAVATGAVAGIRHLADDGKGDLAVGLRGSIDEQNINVAEKSDRLALPNQGVFVVRDTRTMPLHALVDSGVIPGFERSGRDVLEAEPVTEPEQPENLTTGDAAPAEAPAATEAPATATQLTVGELSPPAAEPSEVTPPPTEPSESTPPPAERSESTPPPAERSESASPPTAERRESAPQRARLGGPRSIIPQHADNGLTPEALAQLRAAQASQGVDLITGDALPVLPSAAPQDNGNEFSVQNDPSPRESLGYWNIR